MRHITMNHLALVVLAAALAFPPAGWAQTTGAPAVQADANGAGAAPPAGSPQDRVEQRIADIHATLHVTPAQDAAFETFAQVIRDNAQAMQANLAERVNKSQTMNAVENLGAYANIAEEHAQDVQKLSASFKIFYATLTPDQQKAADVMFRAKAAEHKSAG